MQLIEWKSNANINSTIDATFVCLLFDMFLYLFNKFHYWRVPQVCWRLPSHILFPSDFLCFEFEFFFSVRFRRKILHVNMLGLWGGSKGSSFTLFSYWRTAVVNREYRIRSESLISLCRFENGMFRYSNFSSFNFEVFNQKRSKCQIIHEWKLFSSGTKSFQEN